MAYENTSVPVARSQEAIRKLIYAHRGTGMVFISQRPREGFEAMVELRGKPYHIRITAKCRTPRSAGGEEQHTTRGRELWEKEERRVWRVLFYHLKAVFEAADSDVLSIEEIIMPYVVAKDGRTLAEHILPRLAEVVASPKLMLPGGEL